jgi:hypothetical protein
MILIAFSYSGFRPNVARRRGENSWSLVQTGNRFGPEPVLAVRNWRKPVLVARDRFGTGFFRGGGRVRARVGIELSVRRSGSRDTGSKPGPFKNRRVRHLKIQGRSFEWCKKGALPATEIEEKNLCARSGRRRSGIGESKYIDFRRVEEWAEHFCMCAVPL